MSLVDDSKYESLSLAPSRTIMVFGIAVPVLVFQILFVFDGIMHQRLSTGSSPCFDKICGSIFKIVPPVPIDSLQLQLPF